MFRTRSFLDQLPGCNLLLSHFPERKQGLYREEDSQLLTLSETIQKYHPQQNLFDTTSSTVFFTDTKQVSLNRYDSKNGGGLSNHYNYQYDTNPLGIKKPTLVQSSVKVSLTLQTEDNVSPRIHFDLWSLRFEKAFKIISTIGLFSQPQHIVILLRDLLPNVDVDLEPLFFASNYTALHPYWTFNNGVLSLRTVCFPNNHYTFDVIFSNCNHIQKISCQQIHVKTNKS